jgi:hypothetical protein
MPTIFISEFSNLPIVSNGIIQEPDASTWQTDQAIAVGGMSNPFGNATYMVSLVADTACHIAWSLPGASLAASATNALLLANVPVRFGVQPNMRVSTHS